jgi:hypothetical protein
MHTVLAPIQAPFPFINSSVYTSSFFHIVLSRKFLWWELWWTKTMDKEGLLRDLRAGLHPLFLGGEHFAVIRSFSTDELQGLLSATGILRSHTMTPPRLRSYAVGILKERTDANQRRVEADAAEAANTAYQMVNGLRAAFLRTLGPEVLVLAKKRLEQLERQYQPEQV